MDRLVGAEIGSRSRSCSHVHPFFGDAVRGEGFPESKAS